MWFCQACNNNGNQIIISTNIIIKLVLNVPINIISKFWTLTDFPQLIWSFRSVLLNSESVTNSEVKKLPDEWQATSSALLSLQLQTFPEQFKPNWDGITVALSFPCTIPVTLIRDSWLGRAKLHYLKKKCICIYIFSIHTHTNICVSMCMYIFIHLSKMA